MTLASPRKYRRTLIQISLHLKDPTVSDETLDVNQVLQRNRLVYIDVEATSAWQPGVDISRAFAVSDQTVLTFT